MYRNVTNTLTIPNNLEMILEGGKKRKIYSLFSEGVKSHFLLKIYSAFQKKLLQICPAGGAAAPLALCVRP